MDGRTALQLAPMQATDGRWGRNLNRKAVWALFKKQKKKSGLGSKLKNAVVSIVAFHFISFFFVFSVGVMDSAPVGAAALLIPVRHMAYVARGVFLRRCGVFGVVFFDFVRGREGFGACGGGSFIISRSAHGLCFPRGVFTSVCQIWCAFTELKASAPFISMIDAKNTKVFEKNTKEEHSYIRCS
jgi:hypothetical protein